MWNRFKWALTLDNYPKGGADLVPLRLYALHWYQANPR